MPAGAAVACLAANMERSQGQVGESALSGER